MLLWGTIRFDWYQGGLNYDVSSEIGLTMGKQQTNMECCTMQVEVTILLFVVRDVKPQILHTNKS